MNATSKKQRLTDGEIDDIAWGEFEAAMATGVSVDPFKRTIRRALAKAADREATASDEFIKKAVSSVSNKVTTYRPPPHQLPETGYLRLRQVLTVIPVSKSTWWAGVSSGRFPQPVKLGPRTTAWRVEDIRAWIDKGGEG